MPTLTIVVPAFDEERRLPALLDAVAGTMADDVSAAGLELLEVVIVDDGSTDGTSALAAAAPPPVRLLALPPPNRGKGRALCEGIGSARGDLVLLCDVDLSTPVKDVAGLHDAIRAGADIAIGSRAVSTVATPVLRQVGSRAFNVVVRRATGLRHRDTQRGFKLLRADVARRLTEERALDGFAWDVELLLRAERAGDTVVEVPVRYDHAADSRVGLRSAARAFVDVVLVARALRRS